MSWLRLLYIVSITAVGSLAMFAPVAAWMGDGPGPQTQAAVRRIQLLERDDRWILQLELHNTEPATATYTIGVQTTGEPYLSDFTVEAGGDVTFIHHIYPGDVPAGRLTLSVQRAGDAQPIERVTYHLDASKKAPPGAGAAP